MEVFASVAVALIQSVPLPLASLAAGLATIDVLIQPFEQAFVTGRFKVGAFFALVIAMSGITVFQISAPFWALIGGVLDVEIALAASGVQLAEKPTN